jgi:hypothetical protein
MKLNLRVNDFSHTEHPKHCSLCSLFVDVCSSTLHAKTSTFAVKTSTFAAALEFDEV